MRRFNRTAGQHTRRGASLVGSFTNRFIQKRGATEDEAPTCRRSKRGQCNFGGQDCIFESPFTGRCHYPDEQR